MGRLSLEYPNIYVGHSLSTPKKAWSQDTTQDSPGEPEQTEGQDSLFRFLLKVKTNTPLKLELGAFSPVTP